MRIIHTCLRYPPATGGVETYIKEIVEHTRNIDSKRDVRVLTSKLRTHGPVEELNPDLLLDDPLYIQRLHHAETPFLSYPRLQALRYYLGHHAPDVIHGYSFWYQPADTAARYAKEKRIPFIFHPMYYENAIREKPIWKLYKATIGKKTFAAADVTVAISPFEQRLIEEAGFPVKRFELIPPGIDAARFSAARENPFEKRGIRGTILLTVSRIAPGKGLEDLIAVFPELLRQRPDIQLALAGEDFGLQPELEKQAKAAGIHGQVHFVGKLSDDELAGAYQHADLFVHPSYYEAFGIVLAEALAAGTPVVARNTAAVPFVVPHGKAGLLFNGRDDLAEKINLMLTNTSQAAELTAQGQKRVKSDFTWDTSIQKILKLYAELV